MNKTNELITKMALEGSSAKDIAKATGLNPGAVYTRLSRLGLRLKKGTKCRDAAEYSRIHGIDETLAKFNISREVLHMARSKYL